MNCLILGCGYVGSRVAEKLEADAYRVGRFSRTPAHYGIYPWSGDIPEEFDTLLFAVAPDNREGYKETYLKNAEILAKSHLKRIIYTSSTSVYGEHEGRLVDETSDLKASNDTTQILIDTEQTLLNSGKSVLIFRLGEIVGPGREPGSCLKPVMPGTGENVVNLSPINDIVNGIVFGIQNNLEGVYNLVSDFHPTRKELYQSLGLSVDWDPALPSRHGGNKLVSNAKLKAALQPTVD